MLLSETVKFWAAPYLNRQPVSGLQPERLYAYLDMLWSRRAVEGAVVEIGCYRGGTAAIAHNFLRRTGYGRRYLCIDTFAGFVESQFAHDERNGLKSRHRSHFSRNSIELVRKLHRRYGCAEIELIQADIATVDDRLLPESIAVSLLDVDLELPIYHGATKLFPRLAPGGIILVDDCPEGYDWVGARQGYQRFVRENALPETYLFGMGIIEKPAH